MGPRQFGPQTCSGQRNARLRKLPAPGKPPLALDESHGTFATDEGSQRVESIGNAPEGHDRHATTRGKESPISAHKRLQKVAEVSTGIMRMFQPELTDQIGQVIPTTSAPCVCPPLFVMFESERLGSVTI